MLGVHVLSRDLSGEIFINDTLKFLAVWDFPSMYLIFDFCNVLTCFVVHLFVQILFVL